MGDVDAGFATKFSEVMQRRGLSVQRVADYLRVSVEQVKRWMAGLSAPVYSIQGMILERLEEME